MPDETLEQMRREIARTVDAPNAPSPEEGTVYERIRREKAAEQGAQERRKECLRETWRG